MPQLECDACACVCVCPVSVTCPGTKSPSLLEMTDWRSLAPSPFTRPTPFLRPAHPSALETCQICRPVMCLLRVAASVCVFVRARASVCSVLSQQVWLDRRGSSKDVQARFCRIHHLHCQGQAGLACFKLGSSRRGSAMRNNGSSVCVR